MVDKILQVAQNPNTKFYALQILDEAVNVSVLPSLSSYRLDGKFFLKIRNMV